MKLGGRGRSGGMLTAHTPSGEMLLRTRAATAAVAPAAAHGSLFVDCTAEVML